MFGDGKNKLYSEDDFKKREEENLKGGSGTVTIYEAVWPHEQPNVLEHGYLIVPAGAAIGIHIHSEDWESWEVQMGNVVYYSDNNKPERIGPGIERVCLKGHAHGLVNAEENDAVISFTKYK